MSLATQLGNEIGRCGSVFAEEMRLLAERSSGVASAGGVGIGINSAMEIMTAAMSAAYPKVSADEISGILTHHIGAAMREARALTKK
jgi:hypothetical protein